MWHKISIQKTTNTEEPKNNSYTQKWAEDLNRHFTKKIYTNGQDTHEKMLSITNHYANENQYYSEITTSYPLECLVSKTKTKQNQQHT